MDVNESSVRRLQFLRKISTRVSIDHFLACLCTLLASLRAFLAVIVMMLFALRSAGKTYFAAKTAKVLGHLAIASHCIGSQGAHRGTVHIQRDASSHHLHFGFFQALCEAGVACDGTGVTCLNAVLIGIRSTHGRLLSDGW